MKYLNAWMAQMARRKRAYNRLKNLIGWKDAREVLYLVKRATEGANSQAELLERCCYRICKGWELWQVRADLVEMADGEGDLW